MKKIRVIITIIIIIITIFIIICSSIILQYRHHYCYNHHDHHDHHYHHYFENLIQFETLDEVRSKSLRSAEEILHLYSSESPVAGSIFLLFVYLEVHVALEINISVLSFKEFCE